MTFPASAEQLISQADSLVAKFQQGGGNNYIKEAIVLGRDALNLCPPDHPMRSDALSHLAVHLWHSYNLLGSINDLGEAITLERDALALRPPGHPSRSTSLNNLAVHLSTRYDQLGGVDDLNEAIALSRDVVTLRPPGHPERSTSLSNLAAHLSTRYDQLGGINDLNEAIALSRDVLALEPPGHPGRSTSLSNLAVYLSTRYKQLGGIDDLNEAITLDHDVLTLAPPGHPGRSTSLSNLAVHLSARYDQLGGIDDLNEAIALSRNALTLELPGDPSRSTSLSNLAVQLSTRYDQLGEIDDLNEAITLSRDVLTLEPPGHPDRSTSLSNLAVHLSIRYDQLGGIDDLNEAIALSRDVLTHQAPGHPNRSLSLSNLAMHLSTRYRQLGGIDDLSEAIALSRDALMFQPPGHPGRSTSLSNLAICLSARYKKLGGMDDLDEVIALDHDVLMLEPPGHPGRSTSLSNLAVHLCTRYKKLGVIDDLDGAIALDRDALALRPPGHPGRSTSLRHLARDLCIRFKQLGQVKDKEELFKFYGELEHVSQTVSSLDLSAAKAWTNAAEGFNHPSVLSAYRTALRLLVQHLTTLPSLPRHLTVLKALTSSLAADAFSACLRNRSLTLAVELLEQGRGVFWSQLTRLRSPLDDVIASGPAGKALADEFTRLTSLIRNALDLPGADQHDRVCSLNLELQRVVLGVRELPGLSRFLLPLPFSDLQRAADGGPVIVVNASKYSSDALVIFSDRDPIHIPLSISKEDVGKLSSRLRTLTMRAKKTDMTRELGVFLRDLWRDIISPVVDFLLTTCPRGSRIWWCPTAEISLLPLHAAGPYRKGEKNLSDHYISSYTPTLTALIRARRPSLPSCVTERKDFVAIGQANAAGTRELPSVGTELANIGRLVDGLAMFTHIQGQDSCISRVTGELGRNDWVHLACHGLPNRKQPFDSAFALSDGHLTIHRLIGCNLRNPEFAYLSACHTTVGDEESPDEVIHLASAMQFAGFRSVVGTMWSVDDAETNKITSVFYKHMLNESGRLDHTRAAHALRKAARLADVPLDQRILYIHIGA